MDSSYITDLLALRRQVENRIDNEIQDCLRGRENPDKVKESLNYMIDTSHAFKTKSNRNAID